MWPHPHLLIIWASYLCLPFNLRYCAVTCDLSTRRPYVWSYNTRNFACWCCVLLISLLFYFCILIPLSWWIIFSNLGFLFWGLLGLFCHLWLTIKCVRTRRNNEQKKREKTWGEKDGEGLPRVAAQDV
jgi:hypothetical protein